MASPGATTLSSTSSTRCVPNFKAHWLRGNVDNFARGPIEYYERMQRELGDVVSFRLGRTRIYQVTHPDDVERVFRASNKTFGKGPGWDNTRIMIGDGLITTELEHWIERRRALQPAFLRQYHERFADTFTQTLEQRLPHFRQIARDGEPVSTMREMSRSALCNANLTLLGYDIVDEINDVMTNTHFALDYVTNYYGYSWWKRTLGPYIKRTVHARFGRTRDELRSLAHRAVENRLQMQKRSEKLPHDMLSHLLFEDESGTPRRQSKQYVVDEIMTFLFAAHETTALTLTWAWWFLSQHPEVEQRLHDELHRVLDGRAPTLADLPNLPYGKMIIEETLRLRPPVWSISRQNLQDETFGGYHIPKNAIVLLSPWITHRHPDFWDAPNEFRPERFDPQNRQVRHEYSYMPFGAGPRQCMGKRTALIETQLALATIAQHFTLRPAPDYKAKTLPHVTLRVSEGLPMIWLAR